MKVTIGNSGLIISVMPTNLYGPGDNYDPDNSHVIPASDLRFHNAKKKGLSSVTIWGTAHPEESFSYVDDMARACIHFMNIEKATYQNASDPMCSHLNIGSRDDLTIREVAEAVREVVGYRGGIELDTDMPDGTPRKLMDSTRINNFGWEPKVPLKEGLSKAYKAFLEERASI